MAKAVESLLQEAFAHHKAGRAAQAEGLYRQILERKPDDVRALHHLGLIAHQSERPIDALPLLRRSIQLSGDPPVYFLSNLGNAARAAGDFEESLSALQRAQKMAPRDAGIGHELGLTLEKLGRLDEAVACYRQAIDAGLSPDALRARAFQNLGNVLLQQGKRAEAWVAVEQALHLNPQYALAHMSRASLLFLNGDFQPAWREYEWRWRCKGFPAKWPNWPQPLWDGSDLAGREILLWFEQGRGDSIQFARYVPLVAGRGGRVSVLCPPELKALFATLPGSPHLVLDGEKGPPFSTHAPLLSLPRIFDTRLNTIPANVPYLFADPARFAVWRKRIADRGTGQAFRVGLVWSGNPKQHGDPNRWMTLAHLSPLMATAGVEFYSLQKGERGMDVQSAGPEFRIIDWTADLHDFADTAALIDCLDLVITIDTSVAHLSGAMGKETWTLLQFAADFRWLAEGDRSPWYPTMRLFRQENFGDWPGVVRRVSDELRRRAT
ncbi:MAG: Tetratricopeptide 1 repeat-containing protein [Phycisphaerales bacterium]|nr:Tetratricopeptide 1 repeat-containing protein [Phycisphaerales bacterium]